MALLGELCNLKEEEKALLKIKSALRDQMNRLKVEELTLKSIVRSKNIGAGTTSSAAQSMSVHSASASTHGEEENVQDEAVNEQNLNLEVSNLFRNNAQENVNVVNEESIVDEEDDDDDEPASYEDQLKAFMFQVDKQAKT